MTKEDLVDKVKSICPEMFTHENFMHAAECVFCKEIPNDNRKALSGEEFEAWHNLSDKLCTATVSQLIKYLRENFKLDDKLCYMDCVEGYKNDCTYIDKSQLGSRFFYYVKNLKTAMDRERIDDDPDYPLYPYVNDNDVVVA